MSWKDGKHRSPGNPTIARAAIGRACAAMFRVGQRVTCNGQPQPSVVIAIEGGTLVLQSR